ncbi:helicase with zinc finger domain 2 [Rhineura floridana]|uniref:helicase with zinc finger domain 2 n=1 Tax=Rhineura floridana TaxID=261503 RepID=UPI002AC847BB|nr:helicase with zinc finger domain 2 [Rhineura floridana]XP_061486901.1 helicase with zinc finger domain 2 [Rhineura floridana]XP_061486902.1 helicase with zinc finger domain 2 [Rhineura floridana]XP_061486903.1 helicase with zinc finger domain 2 [Rhineura floridana]XP_061486904.1 helicase with zinc finger domain 2 [Rhineura floridana]XP_061486905.1 helicase with zinc finger domain 2 [Rhineura floridana]
MPRLNRALPTLLDGLQEQVTLYLACSKCSQQENESTYSLKEVEHHCMMEILLAKRKGKRGKPWRKVNRRPSFPNPTHYDICRYYVPGLGCTKHRNRCTFAWSKEEAIVWTFERANSMERSVLKMLVQWAQTGSIANGLSKPPNPSVSEEIWSEFGGHFQEICRLCFYRTPQRICPKDSAQTCETHWSALLVHVISGGKMKEQYTEIRPCPGGIKKFSYCRYVSAGKLCRHTVHRCNYAHSDVELAVWEAERSHALARTDLLCPSVDHRPGEAASQPKVQFYCRVCLVTCDSQESFENHCSSVEHLQLIPTDTLIEWSHRAPPYGLKAFALCNQADVCEYGEDCIKAHSSEELEEWIQRAKVSEKNKRSAKQDGLLSYQDRLVAEYQESHNEVLIISEEVDGVKVTCPQSLRVQSEDKKMQYRWVFTVHSQKPLMHVALLKRLPGATFYLAGKGHSRGLTYASGERFKTQQASPLATQVDVCMECHTFGVYDQWLVFDFGSRPVLVQKFQARVGQRESPWHVSPALEQSSCFVDFERWHSGNRVVVPSVDRTSKELELLAKYKAPSLSLNFRRGAEGKPIARLNYREQMHNFLFREEEAQQALIAKLNLQVIVSLQQMMETLSMGMRFALPGMLYAHVPTPYSLTPDSNEGYLLYRSVKTAFLALDPPANNRVFEVSVETKATTEKSIWLLLPQRCCVELGLEKDSSLKVEVQFQIDQLQFRHWHHAVDKLWDVRLVLPDVAACSIPRPPGQVLLQRGNQKQNQAISFITGQVAGVRQVPPLLIYGPFGTGKTFTLAMATLEIIKQPKTRVLICTHTNSAADIYIREYFHDYVTSGHPEAVPLRVKYFGHVVKTTDPITQLYCCFSPSRDAFRFPTKEELDQHQIIITTCMLSQELGLAPGYFSHILIDEAAQMLECETLVPLSLATSETRIILAGDHMQTTPKVFCLQGGEQSADHTLLNRLFQYYQKEKHEVALKSRIIFSENYRSTASIIDFVSRHFYTGKGDAIRAGGNIPPHPDFHPLMFCHVAGSAERDASMTSWYNTSEVGQVVEKVQEMVQRWPGEWGEQDFERICVVSYGIQVMAIRQELRKKRLGQVVVENYENLPGREFRMIIISTIHTRETLGHVSSSNLDFFNDARALNTIMTRAQSQVIAVGDAVALCSYGQCSKVWKGFLKECIDKKTVTPETLSLEEIRQAVCDRASWNRGSPQLEEEGSDTDSWLSDSESLNVDDPILQELLDESKVMMVTVSDEGLMNVKSEVSTQSSRQEYMSFSPQTMKECLRMNPNMYKRCELIKECFDQASAFTLDDVPPLKIHIRGRVHCGMGFTGDQVLVEILQPNTARAMPKGSLRGKVVGVLKKADRDRTFICTVDEFDLRVMVPIDRTVTKIFVPGLKDGERNVIPIRSLDQGGKVKLKTRKRITEENKKNWLFVVQVMSWRDGFYYPLGIVTEVLPLASTLEEGLRILDIEYCLTNKYPTSVNNEAAKFSSSKLAVTTGSRKDCRAYLTFTVDPADARDLDDAISVRDLGEKYEIGIHIADIASVIPKGCALDTEAKKRGATYYAPGKEPLCMFPPQLSQGLCSLLPQKDRPVISLFVLVDKKTDQMTNSSFAVSSICSDRQLTYEEAEGIIKYCYKAEAPLLRFDSLEACVAVAYHFSRVHRCSRLHEDCYYDQLDEECPLGQRSSHQMVEEFMIMFNSSVGEFLTNNVPTRDLIPLRCQTEPNPEQITQMREKYRDIIPLSTHLSHHLGSPTTKVHMGTCRNFVLLASLWDYLRSAADACDIPKMLDLITTDDIHPKLAPVNMEFRKLLSRSYFLRSNSSAQSKVGHYSLHVDSYTWATSPIRRYIDVVLQRHILSVIFQRPVQYSLADVEFLCHDFNRKNGMANAYEKKAHSLEMAAQLKRQVQQKASFVVNVEGMAKNFKIVFPLNKETLPDPHLVNYRALQLVAQPSFVEERNSMKLMWRRRIYSVMTSKECIPKSPSLRDKSVALFNVQAWCEVLQAVRNKDYKKMISLLEKGHSTQVRTIGRMERSRCSHYVDLSLELSAGDVLYLQLTTGVQRGFLVPSVQLWAVAPGFDVCVEHSEKPINCFSKYATQASKKVYRNASDYRKVWLPLSDMESASCAVAENESIVLYDVKISWEKRRTKQGQLQGTFSLSKDFLKECAIEVDFAYCYMCIRLSGLRADGAQDDAEALGHSLQQLTLTEGNAKAGKFTIDPATYTWVAHGRTGEFEDDEKSDERGQRMVCFYIHFMSMEKIPVEVTQETSMFTVELIPKLLPDVRKEKAIWRLQHAVELAQGIALGWEISEKSMKRSPLLARRIFDLPGRSPRLNHSQNVAILEALRKPYTLIQGPPGTGKTVVGAHIVYWFHQLNQESKEKEPTLDDKDKAQSHILYCGPSNKSVDVVAEMLLKMTSSLRPLRVYGDTIETMDFPYPGSSLHISRKAQRDSKPKPEIRDITLHYVIRRPSNPFGPEICKFDARVKRGEEITEDEIVKYKKLVSSARVHELQRHDVILCTCSASCANTLTEHLHVKQVLIDECAMSTEPETLIPLVSYKKLEKVVLLGDHKQLRPVVHNDFCKTLGMETSLFERYKHRALMLDTQYRMHRDICQFPSEAFYDRRLRTWSNLKRGCSTLCHKDRAACCAIIFGHIEGREKSLMVSTEDGNENSRANLEEAEQAVRITKQLTLDRTTKPAEIAILTPYNAQVVEVKKLLSQEGLRDVTVCTIMKSQGSEWKYVIMSTVRSCARSEVDKRPTKSWQKKHLGFVTDPNQINVCITRAQEGLCIIGNGYLLESNPLWRRLLEHYRNHGCFTAASEIQIRKKSAISRRWMPTGQNA